LRTHGGRDFSTGHRATTAEYYRERKKGSRDCHPSENGQHHDGRHSESNQTEAGVKFSGGHASTRELIPPNQTRMRMMAKPQVFSAVVIAAVVGGMVAVLSAQTSDKPAFEVVSIRPAARATGEALGSPSEFQSGGRYIAPNTSLRNLLIQAYAGDQFTLRREQIIGLPSWSDSTFFDIEAKVAGNSSSVPIPRGSPTHEALIRSLLADRFKLKAHTESREFSVYVLLLARSDGTLGPKLRPSLVDCKALLEAARGNPPQPFPPPPAGRPQCGVRRVFGSLVAGGAAMTTLIGVLGSNAELNAPVLDRTGLTGSYDIELEWQPLRGGDALADKPSIQTALREQLGLTLQTRREPMDVLVIDHVEQPTAN